MGIISNFLYDVAAIKKYGLIRHIKYLFDLKHAIVILQTHLDYVPDFKPIAGYEIKEVDYKDPRVLSDWIQVVNEAFSFEKPYDVESALKYLENHPYKKIESLFMVYHSSTNSPVGSVFIARFRNNERIGISGRIAIIPSHQRKGLGRMIALYGYERMRERGIQLTEHVFNLEKSHSISLFMNCGSLPQFNRKYMQFSPTRKSWIVSMLARRKVDRLYNDHLARLRRPFIGEGSKDKAF